MFGKNLFKVILTESALFSPESVNDTILAHTFFRLRQLTGFYLRALTRYQLHSPFVFEWANAVLEDRRWYYPFRDIEALRARVLAVDTKIWPSGFGAAPAAQQQVRLGKVVRRSAVSPEKGRMLFRLVNWLRPTRMLELGCSAGISAMYLDLRLQSARLLTLEGDAALAALAQLPPAGLATGGSDRGRISPHAGACARPARRPRRFGVFRRRPPAGADARIL